MNSVATSGEKEERGTKGVRKREKKRGGKRGRKWRRKGGKSRKREGRGGEERSELADCCISLLTEGNMMRISCIMKRGGSCRNVSRKPPCLLRCDV